MTTIRTQWQRIQNYIWLVCGLVCLLAALIFWAMTDREALVEIKKSAETESELQIQPEKVAATNLLGALQDEVRPLEMTKRVVVTARGEPEFRGSKFINENKRASTIELFRVTKDDIIESFLKKQADRKNYFYIRLSGENQIEQYVLFYGIYDNAAEAKQHLQQLPVKFPKTIQPKVQDIKNYVPLVNDMGAEETTTNQKIYAVKLKPAALPRLNEGLISTPKPVVPVSNAPATTRTTVTRRDQQGQVVDVQQSHTTVEPTPKPSVPNQVNKNPVEKEINDPFN